MTVHQHGALLEILGHHHQGFIDGTVPVGVVFTHGITHDTGTFPVGAVIFKPQLMHVVESPPLHRL